MTLYFLDCEMHCGGKLDGIWLWDSANVLEQVTRSLHLSPSAFLVGRCIRPGDMREMVVVVVLVAFVLIISVYLLG